MNHEQVRHTALITGASRGIGAAIAMRLAQQGHNVVIHYRESHDAAAEVAKKCSEFGVRTLIYAADVRDRDQILHMKETLDQHDLTPDILINNAGISHYGMLSDVTESQWDLVMDVNLKGAFLSTQTFMPAMIRQRYGRIINVSSIWGISGASCEVIYSTAKGGMNAFTKALAKELAPSGVTVNAVAPGAVDTGMLSQFTSDEQDDLRNEIPLGRFASPEEIASLVYFLSLPESGYITGQVISPNGGWLT